MIKFFSKIHYNLIEQNKTRKYFKYAIGEIILVVVGVLIALQINNWNEIKKSHEKERQVLTETGSDLKFSIQDMDRVIHKRTNNLNRTINSIQTIITILETDQPYHDSLAYYFRAVNSYSKFNFKNSGYQSLISIGTDLIKDPKLRSAFGKFHTSSIASSKSLFEEIHLDFYSYIIDYYRKDFTTVFVDNSFEKLVPNKFKDLKKDNEYT